MTKPSRPPPSAASPAPKRPAVVAPQVLIVSSTALDDALGIETLVGEYVECGSNHGHKVYKRRLLPSGESASNSTTIFIYYWDLRDGADFSGWWFGQAVGGAQVWSRNEQSDDLPPRTGWRIPWDGSVNDDLMVALKPPKPTIFSLGGVKQEVKEELLDSSIVTEADERVQQATDQVVLAEIESKQALESAIAMMEGEVTEEDARSVVELLDAQLKTLLVLHKSLASDIVDARRRKPDSVAAFNKLTQRVRSVQENLADESKHASEVLAVKRKLASQKNKEVHPEATSNEALPESLNEEAQALPKEPAAKDSRMFEADLSESMEAASLAEQLLEAVVSAVSTLSRNEVENDATSTEASITAAEGAWRKAALCLKKARALIAKKVLVAKQYSAATQPLALEQYTAIQDRLKEVEKKLQHYSTIRKDFTQRSVIATKIKAVAQRFATVEAEMEKDGAQAGLAVVSSWEAKVGQAVNFLKALTEKKSQELTETLSTELTQLTDRGQSMVQRLSALRNDSVKNESFALVRQALGKVADAELKAQATEEALKTEAVYHEILRDWEVKVFQARKFLKALSAKTDLPESAAEELAQLGKRLQFVAHRLEAFRRDSSKHESSLFLREAFAKVEDAEAKAKAAEEAGYPVTSASGAAEASGVGTQEAQLLKDATNKLLQAEKVAALAFAEASKVLSMKQREVNDKFPEVSAFVEGVAELRQRLQAAQQVLSKQRKVALHGEKLWKARLVLGEAEERLKEVAELVEKADVLTTPLGDEAIPPQEHVAEMETAVSSAQTALDDVASAVEVAQKKPPSESTHSQAKLNKLASTAKDFQDSLDNMRLYITELRERVNFEAVLQEARSALKKVQAALSELPEAKADASNSQPPTLQMRDSAANAVQHTLGEARAFVASRMLELRQLSDNLAQYGQRELDSISALLGEAGQHLGEYRRLTEAQRKVQQEQELLQQIKSTEDSVQRTTQDAEQLRVCAPEDAEEACKRFAELANGAAGAIEASRQLLVGRMRDKRLEKGDKDEVVKLSRRLDEAEKSLSQAKDTAQECEQRLTAQQILQKASEILPNLESALSKAAEAADPLLANGGKEFTTARLSKTASEAILQYLHQTKGSRKEFFEKHLLLDSDAQAGVSSKAFTDVLGKLPELCQRSDLSFSSKDCKAIFEQADKDSNGSLSFDEFQLLFKEQYVCTKRITLTDTLEIDGSKSLQKLDIDDVVESVDEPCVIGDQQLVRVKVRSLKDGTEGWVTMKGSQGTIFLRPLSLYGVFSKGLEQVLAAAQEALMSAKSFLNAKAAQLRPYTKGPLVEARSDLAKLKPQLTTLQARLEELQLRVDVAERTQSAEEEEHQRVRQRNSDRLRAGPFAADSNSVEAVSKNRRLFVAAAPVAAARAVGLSGAALEDDIPSESSRRIRELLPGEVLEVLEDPHNEPACQVQRARGKASDGSVGWFTVVNRHGQVFCKSVSRHYTCTSSIAMTETFDLKQSKVVRKLDAGEQLMLLSGPDEDPQNGMTRIKAKTVRDNLEGWVTTRGSAGGIFAEVSSQQFIVERTVPFQNVLQSSAVSTPRMLAEGELLEVTEGPREETLEPEVRIHCKALSDGSEGWVTLRNRNLRPWTPVYRCVAAGAQFQGSRRIELGEVVQLLEGPRLQESTGLLELMGRAEKDGVVGWVTLTGDKEKMLLDCIPAIH